MPSQFFCWHSYGDWGKLRNGYKARRCKKCGKTEKQKAGFFDQLFCWHQWHRKTRKDPALSCKKCGKPKG